MLYLVSTFPAVLRLRQTAGSRIAVAQQSLGRDRSSMSDATAASSRPVPSPAAALDFLTLLTKLKVTKRTGWVYKGVDQPESIADHMYRMGMMALIAGGTPDIDYNRCIKIALCHDVAEAIVGDITPHDNVPPQEKKRLETAAVDRIQAMLGPGTAAALEVATLWDEYEAAETPEAQLVKDFDKLEMILQASEYESAQDMDLEEFFTSTAGKFKTELGRSWAAEIVGRRNARRLAKDTAITESSRTAASVPP